VQGIRTAQKAKDDAERARRKDSKAKTKEGKALKDLI
jgi:hypothetical protein